MTREFGSSVYAASFGLLDKLRQEYRMNPKPHVWAVAVLTQGFRVPSHIAIEVLTEKRECQVQDQKLSIQMD